ncbi:MAG: LPXTG cell wall anchor domain-containing protein [Actinomycetota bacterium]|nr:LPXTG cell wall anchor domain-containing protein [Actinomycetota bacterium]
MFRPRPLATVIAACALLAAVLAFAPIGSTRSGLPTLSPTPPVTLAPPSTAPTTTTTPARPRLPKTGLEASLVALTGLGLLACGAALRRTVRRSASRRRW